MKDRSRLYSRCFAPKRFYEKFTKVRFVVCRFFQMVLKFSLRTFQLPTFSGITSAITTNITGIIPQAAKNSMPEKLAIEIHE